MVPTPNEEGEDIRPRSSKDVIVAAIYRQILRREADKEGLEHHLRLLEEGTRTVRELVTGFLNSEEWRSRFQHSRTPNEALIALYRCALCRTPAPEELEALAPLVARDWSSAVRSVVESAEYRERFGENLVPEGPRDRSSPPGMPSTPVSREPLSSALPEPSDIKALAFYLPQFHRIPENDKWWGEGFTEWANVRRAEPNFEDHYQPHIPSVLGYYDLTESAVMERQADLARGHGIYGFCYYYYWFGGAVLLDLPLRRILESGIPDLPFCLCWANENWTRRWDGLESEVLISQAHSAEDDLAFIERIEPLLLHRNYIRVEGRPLLSVYRASLLPDSVATTVRWRKYFRSRGHGDLHLVMIQSFTDQVSAEARGFDAAVQFPPHFPCEELKQQLPGMRGEYAGQIYNYDELKDTALEQLREAALAGTKLYAGVMPSWDNTARRREQSAMWLNSSPESYRNWLAKAAALLRQRPPEERFVFINAWNEWAEGCHLEPDERHGYAWLNATASALKKPSAGFAHARPVAPVPQKIAVSPLPCSVRIAVSVLLYHREDILAPMLIHLLPQILEADRVDGMACELFLSFNYQPSPAALEVVRRTVADVANVHVVENGYNFGFGAGHNAILARSDCALMILLNSDVRMPQDDWIAKIVERFRSSEAAIVGLTSTASRLREDGCGIPVPADADFDFVDGSVLAIRADLARRFGLFSELFNPFYFEDADLCLRYRQLGLSIVRIDLPYEHERSSSSRLLPAFTIGNVLNRNRARFFSRWRGYLETRELPNRLGITFREADRAFQCASLPALFSLLREHPTAILDLAGVHEQLASFFQHPRIRLIPAWQSLAPPDYSRCYELVESTSGAESRAEEIARVMDCVPDYAGARAHLESVAAGLPQPAETGVRNAFVFVARPEPLFEGRVPAPAEWANLAALLFRRGLTPVFYTDLGIFEVEAFSELEVNCVALRSGVEILQHIVLSELVVASESWIAELAQLAGKETFLWLGAISPLRAVLNFEGTGFFVDRALPCLGCYHRFGEAHRNTCLRGDVACLRGQLNDQFATALEEFLDGARAAAADVIDPRFREGAARPADSEMLLLEHWPRSSASSVLVLIPKHPLLSEAAAEQARGLALRAIEGLSSSRVVLDSGGEAPLRGLPHPQRQSAMAAIRQGMIDRHLRDERWVFWVDADIVDYPANLIDQLIARVAGGVAAPLVLMEGDSSEPLSNKFGFGPGRFYDVAGFVERGRWARFTPPYFDQLGPVYELDSVGSCYLVNAELYRQGAKHSLDPASRVFTETGGQWSDDSISRNQSAPADCFTEHYTVCQFARDAGLPVQAFADLVAYHEKP